MDTNQLKNTQLLSPFLRDLASNIDNGKISDELLQLVGEFYMSYLFAEQVRNDNKKKRRKRPTKRNSDDKELQKFLCLGWYIYNKILKDETL
jgi:hypothetical protein